MNDSNQTLIRYLLGRMSESECAELEQKYFADPVLFRRLVEAENDLLDDYARDQLAPDTRAVLEAHYRATPERRDRLHFADALSTRIERDRAVAAARIITDSRWIRWRTAFARPAIVFGLAALCLLFLIAGSWWVFERRRQNKEFAHKEMERFEREEQHDLEKQQEDQRTRENQLANQSQPKVEGPNPGPSPTPPGRPIVASLVITIGDVRGVVNERPATLLIAPGTEKVRFGLNLQDNSYQSYTIDVRSAGGHQAFRKTGLESKSKQHAKLTTIAPAANFQSGDYILTLQGMTSDGTVEDVSKSLFHVERK